VSGGLRKRQRPYLTISSATVNDRRLSFKARGILSYLLDKPDGWAVRAAAIAADSDADGVAAIQSGLRELARRGYYRIERQRLLDGRLVTGTAVSEEAVEQWAQEYAEYGGPVPVIRQPDGTFKVRRKDGRLTSDGFDAPCAPADPTDAADESGEQPRTAHPEELDVSAGHTETQFSDSGSTDPGSPDVGSAGIGQPPAFISTEQPPQRNNSAPSERAQSARPVAGRPTRAPEHIESPTSSSSSPGHGYVGASASAVTAKGGPNAVAVLDPAPSPLARRPSESPPQEVHGPAEPGQMPGDCETVQKGRIVAGQPTARDLIADYVRRHCVKRPPGRVLGHLGKLIAEMLAEGIDPADIRAGLAAWHTKNLHPSTLPSVVHEAMNRPATSAGPPPGARRSARSTTDERMAQAQALKAKFRAIQPSPITGEVLR
jgi:hypothetical protein